MMNSSGLRDRVRKKKVNNTVFISKVIEYQREMNDSKKEKIKSYTQYIYIYYSKIRIKGIILAKRKNFFPSSSKPFNILR